MPFVTINRGGPEVEIPEGVYRVVLVDIGDPHTVTAQRGPNAGSDVDLIDWTFAIDQPGTPLDGQPITDSSSTASGPKSKLFAWITALQNGRPPAVGQGFEKSDLKGRSAFATIRVDDGGYPKIANLGAIPIDAQQQRFAQVTGTPVTGATPPAAAPLRQQVAPQPNSDLPF